MTWSFFSDKEQRKQRKPRRNQQPPRTLAPGRRRPHFEALEDRRMLAVLTVNSLLDTTVAADGLVTLREAIIASNTDTATDLGEVGSDADTIQFSAGLTGTITLAGAAQLSITDAVTINGPGAALLSINGAAASRIFNITDAAGDVTLNALTLTNGNSGAADGGGAIFSKALGLLSINNSVITGNTGKFAGAIYSDGDVSLTNTTIGGIGALKNIATNGGGGAIFTYHNVTMKNSTISGNTATAAGGGIISYGLVSAENSTIGGSVAGSGNTAGTVGGGIYAQSVNLLNSTVSGNSSTNQGGGIYSTGGLVSVKLSTVSGNQSGGKGGGIYSSGIVTLESSTIGGTTTAAGNKATNAGAGIFAMSVTATQSTIANNQSTGASAQGGGIYANTMTLRNTTIASNLSDLSGGGVAGFTITSQNSTFANNVADNDNNGTGSGGGIVAITTLKMTNSIVIGNSDTGGAAPDMLVPVGSNVRFSLIGDNTGLPAGAQFTVTGPAGAPNSSGNRIGSPGGANAIAIGTVLDTVGGLKDNGGATPTIALAAASLAIDKGKNSLVVSPGTGDQRGLPFVRTFNGTVDMGAFEFQTVALNAAPTVANIIPDQTTVVGSPFVFTFNANTFADADGDVLTYTATLSPIGALPAWLTFTQGTVGRTFVGVPAVTDIGSVTIRVTASDGKGGFISDDFVLTVTSNPPPTLANAIADQHATVAIPFNYVVPATTFTDPNGDPLTYSATLTGGGALPAWLSFNPATRAFTGTPGAGDIGTINVRVTATDPTGGSAFDDFAILVDTSELPFKESFESLVDARLSEKSPAFATTTSSPISGTQSYQATRPTVGSRPVSTVDFANPTTASTVTNIAVNVSTLPGNGTSLWSNAVVVFDYQSPTNYKFAGVFQIIHKLIIGQVVNGKVSYLATKKFNASANTTIPLNVAINRATNQVTLTSGGTSVAHQYKTFGTGTVGVGTINANAKFDDLVVG